MARLFACHLANFCTLSHLAPPFLYPLPTLTARVSTLSSLQAHTNPTSRDYFAMSSAEVPSSRRKRDDKACEEAAPVLHQAQCEQDPGEQAQREQALFNEKRRKRVMAQKAAKTRRNNMEVSSFTKYVLQLTRV